MLSNGYILMGHIYINETLSIAAASINDPSCVSSDL